MLKAVIGDIRSLSVPPWEVGLLRRGRDRLRTNSTGSIYREPKRPSSQQSGSNSNSLFAIVQFYNGPAPSFLRRRVTEIGSGSTAVPPVIEARARGKATRHLLRRAGRTAPIERR